MTLRSIREAESIRKKLRLLEQQVANLKKQPNADQHAKQLTIQSLTQLINQLKEELARFEAKSPG
jgi:hypothetical protein